MRNVLIRAIANDQRHALIGGGGRDREKDHRRDDRQNTQTIDRAPNNRWQKVTHATEAARSTIVLVHSDTLHSRRPHPKELRHCRSRAPLGGSISYR